MHYWAFWVVIDPVLPNIKLNYLKCVWHSFLQISSGTSNKFYTKHLWQLKSCLLSENVIFQVCPNPSHYHNNFLWVQCFKLRTICSTNRRSPMLQVMTQVCLHIIHSVSIICLSFNCQIVIFCSNFEVLLFVNISHTLFALRLTTCQ